MKVISGLTNDYEKSNSITLPSYSQFCLQSKRRKWPRYGRDIITMTGESCSLKLADLVVLGQNPLKVHPMTLKEIRVMETIKEGKTIFKKQFER